MIQAESLRALARELERAAAEIEGVRELDQAAPDLPQNSKEIRDAIGARRLRETVFGPSLFTDPAWDMLLELFARRIEGGGTTVTGLATAAAVPLTTALRWISTLLDLGLLYRQNDPIDRRKTLLRLSDKGGEAMSRYMGTAKSLKLPIA